jgi:hypothetical protein
MKTFTNIAIALVLTAAAAAAPTPGRLAQAPQSSLTASNMAPTIATTSPFKGIEVNGGTASLYKTDGVYHLKVGDGFKIPATPAPHWQVVDDKGNVYLLQRFLVKGDKTHLDIALPKYIHSVAKVQVWCAFAEVLLGEAPFEHTQTLR